MIRAIAFTLLLMGFVTLAALGKERDGAAGGRDCAKGVFCELSAPAAKAFLKNGCSRYILPAAGGGPHSISRLKLRN
jgi:hypothetical protein